jgi:hypothetical protein
MRKLSSFDVFQPPLHLIFGSQKDLRNRLGPPSTPVAKNAEEIEDIKFGEIKFIKKAEGKRL